ncbi:caspase family protein [Neotabrizicola sp. VNH66]|uniref:caspase family protein n=1 Tax=Neotabrizicola sp. VNH66 TaxID=3400918 RepID=UPI003BFB8010
MKPRLTYALLTSVALLAAPAAKAEVLAVLVGVGEYLYLDANLQGPGNDVRLMAETLEARGVAPSAMTVLTSDAAALPQGVTTAAPTRDGIMAALEATAAKAQPGDTVVFYFSGHGSQAPDMSGDEGGGYDEIFLPSDAKNWKGEIGMVENAILDDELQVWAQSLLSRGVKLVGMIDACHSDTGFRSTEGQGVARALDEGLLGIPEGTPSAPATAPLELTGDFVFLYSSQSDERSFEYPLGDTGLWHGEFTLRLAQTLTTAPEASWQQVLAATADAMVQGPARQEPAGEGPLLTEQVFGTGTAAARYRIEGGKLAAGLLQGVEAGAELALYAAGAGGDPLAQVTVTSATAREAVLPAGLPEGALWAEVIAAAPPAPLTLAAPVRADVDDGRDYAAWTAALPEPGAKPDLVPILVDGTVALAGADGVLDPEGPGSTPRVERLGGETEAEALDRALTVAAHGLRLRETLAGATGRSVTGKDALTVTIDRRSAAAEGAGCGTAADPAPWRPDEGAAPCDQLWLTVTNTSGKTQDVSVLYMAADFEVQPIWPRSNIANRLAPGETIRVGLQIEAGSVAGVEEIWVLGVPVEGATGQRVDLTRLATPGGIRNLAGVPDPMTAWLDSRLAIEDEEAGTMRGFSLKPAALTMIRQVVRLKPGSV